MTESAAIILSLSDEELIVWNSLFGTALLSPIQRAHLDRLLRDLRGLVDAAKRRKAA